MTRFFLLGIFLISGLANAALVGRMPATQNGTDYQLWYDTDQDITWLADTNVIATGLPFSLDFGLGLDTTTGQVNWYGARYAIAQMNSNNYLGVNTWRLPFTPSTYDVYCSSGTYGYNCTNSELGHLFYQELGASAGGNVNTTGDPAQLAKFSNLDPARLYISNQVTAPWAFSSTSFSYTSAWYMSFQNGYQRYNYKDRAFYTLLPVFDGDIAAVPVPPALFLMLSGIAGLGLAARGRKAG